MASSDQQIKLTEILFWFAFENMLGFYDDFSTFFSNFNQDKKIKK